MGREQSDDGMRTVGSREGETTKKDDTTRKPQCPPHLYYKRLGKNYLQYPIELKQTHFNEITMFSWLFCSNYHESGCYQAYQNTSSYDDFYTRITAPLKSQEFTSCNNCLINVNMDIKVRNQISHMPLKVASTSQVYICKRQI